MIAKDHMINDRYRIIRMIGEGGMANVYLAYDTILDRNVAIKILRGDLADDEKFVRRFQREAIAASSLTHPNIVEMYDVGEDDGKYFIVMEYIEGKTLKSLIKKRGALTLPEVVDIMLQLTSGIACAHDSYIIHRDIKPQNIMILDDGRVKITDFGIAVALNNHELTQTNSVMGSVHYLPPEQATGDGATIKSDIYSLGILMYELLVGKVPFKGDNAVEIAIKQMKEPIPSICEFNPDIPQSIENVVLRACAKNPKNRYESVQEMHDDIKTALNEERKDELKLTYKYVEQDLEETKVMPDLRNLTVSEDKKEMAKPKKKVKVLNIIMIVLFSLISVVVAGASIAAIIFGGKEKKEVTIPDISGMTVVDAEKELKKLGLNVAKDVEQKNSSTIPEGDVVETKPQVGRTVKVDTDITLVVSIGENKIVLEDYVGQNYYDVQGILKALDIYVLVDKKEVSDKKNAKENVVIEQNPKAGTALEAGDTVTLYIADLYTEYPDFVSEGWTLSAVQEFCDKYGVTLKTEQVETDKAEEGTILSQSRTKGTKVVSKTELVVKVAKALPKDPVDDLLPQE